ncbi:MAG: helix-turn-helix transcriptional regulator [Firmicutes bacterium]|nr:helix-turn-helix transcriptional regulator [Bacillota bacterium]
MSDPEVNTVASLIGDASRATMLVHLMGGQQLPASDLARIAHVAPATASEHLAKLVAGGLIRVRQHGRHRYYALASPEVARVIEGLMTLAPAEQVHSLRSSTRHQQLREARICYDHLAGALGTGLTEAMTAQGWLTFDTTQDALTLTPAGLNQATIWGWKIGKRKILPTSTAGSIGVLTGGGAFFSLLNRQWGTRAAGLSPKPATSATRVSNRPSWRDP